jgi:hypothetical protein
VKKLFCLFIVMAMFAFSGCATGSGSSSAGSSGGSKSTLSEADFQRIGITHGGYGNSN